MHYPENVKAARSCAERAMEALAAHDLPATPHNFSIWYAHLSGRHPDLSETIAKLEEEKGGVTIQAARRLYAEFFTEEREEQVIRQTGVGSARNLRKS